MILQKKLLFCHHLSNLPEQSLGREFFDLQWNNGLVGLVEEMKVHLQSLGVVDLKTISKGIWKKKVKSYVVELNRQELIEESKKYKKIDSESLKYEEFKRKDYFYSLRLEDVRLKLKLKAESFQPSRTMLKENIEVIH